MKKLIVLLSLAMFSFGSFASSEIKAESSDSSLKILELVVGIKSTYSKSSELDAKVVELLGGDGMNPTRMVLVLNTGYDSKTFELGEMMYQVDRITFSDIDTIVINYTQDTFGDLGNMDDLDDYEQIQVKRSMEIKVVRDSKGQLSDKIIVKNLK
jgi:hypothetical protein